MTLRRSDPPADLRALRAPDEEHCAICGIELVTGERIPHSGPRDVSGPAGTLALSAPAIHDPYFWAFCHDCYPRLSLALGATLASIIRDHQAKKRRI
jgi:hypothetical protein